jgi:transcriptional regulator with XRE-family HTH domain
VGTTGDGDGIGQLLRVHRWAAGLSQRQLAERAGMSLGAIRDLEQGRTRLPQRRFVDAMVAALNLSGDGADAFRRAADEVEAPVTASGPGRPGGSTRPCWCGCGSWAR